MIAKIAICLFAAALCTACTTTQTASTNGGRQTLEQRLLAQQSAASPYAANEPMPPAEGPEDVPAEGPMDPTRNPALVPSPLLRANASSGL